MQSSFFPFLINILFSTFDPLAANVNTTMIFNKLYSGRIAV